MKCIYKGDDAPNLIEIELINDYDYQINKLITTCGKITHIYNNPVFPFSEGYTASETLQFDLENTFYAGVEIEGLGFRTFNGYLKFRACPQYVKREITNNEQINNNSENNTPHTIRFELSDGIDIEAIFKIVTDDTVWGTISGDITDQTDLIDLIDTKIDIEATARENNDLALQNGINTLNDDLTAEISNRGTADTTLQDNIDTLSDTVTNNYNTLDGKITDEATARGNADNNLQSQIDALVVASDVFDIVGTYAELQAYDISTVPVNDIIKVLVDSTHNNTATYYRCVENDNVKSWFYIGPEGAYYTKSEADNRFVKQTTTINGQALSNNISLDAEDVGALPDSTTINDLTTESQQNALNSGITSSLVEQISTNESDITDLQNGLDTKQNTITGGASTITSNNLTANRALISSDSGKVAVSSITSTQLSYLINVTSDIQTQINSKTSNVGTITGIKMNNVTVGTSGLVDLGDVMTIQGYITDWTSVDSLYFGIYSFDNVSNSQLPVTTNASGFLVAYNYYGQICLVGNKMYYRQHDPLLSRFGNWQVAITDFDLSVKQDKSNLVTSLSASSTDTQYPSAKCVYDLVGDIETALNTINSGVSS